MSRGCAKQFEKHSFSGLRVVFTKDTLHYVCTHLSKTFSNWSLLLSSSLTDYQSKAN